MPIYSYKCACGHKTDRVLPLARYREPQFHEGCLAPMLKVIVAPAVLGDYEGYDCPITGKRVEGRKAHRENLAVHGCRLLEPGEHTATVKRKAAEEAAFDASIEETADRFIAGLPTEKRDRLAAEMEGGLDVQIERKTV